MARKSQATKAADVQIEPVHAVTSAVRRCRARRRIRSGHGTGSLTRASTAEAKPGDGDHAGSRFNMASRPRTRRSRRATLSAKPGGGRWVARRSRPAMTSRSASISPAQQEHDFKCRSLRLWRSTSWRAAIRPPTFCTAKRSTSSGVRCRALSEVNSRTFAPALPSWPPAASRRARGCLPSSRPGRIVLASMDHCFLSWFGSCVSGHGSANCTSAAFNSFLALWM